MSVVISKFFCVSVAVHLERSITLCCKMLVVKCLPPARSVVEPQAFAPAGGPDASLICESAWRKIH